LVPGISYAALPGDPSDVSLGVVLIIISIAMGYMLTAIFLSFAAEPVFGKEARRSVSANLRELPRLVVFLLVMLAVFACLSGLIAVLIYYVIAAGQQIAQRGIAIDASAFVLMMFGLPFFLSAYARFASGVREGFAALFKKAVRMGWRGYLRLLAVGASAMGAATALRYLMGSMNPFSDHVIGSLIVAIVFGVALPLSWSVHAATEVTGSSGSAKDSYGVGSAGGAQRQGEGRKDESSIRVS
jgi:hypothetical protein